MTAAGTLAVMPRVYRISTSWRWFLNAGGCVIAPVFGLGSIYLCTQSAVCSWWFMAIILGIGWAMASVMILGMLDAHVTRLELCHDALRLHCLFRDVTVRIEEFRGYRVVPQAHSVFLIRTGQRRRFVKIPTLFAHMDEIQAWLAERLPDLDVQEAAAEVQTLEASAAFGVNQQQLDAALAAARWKARVVTIVTLGVMVWPWILPRYVFGMVIILALLPPLAVAMAWHSRGLLRLLVKPKAPYGNLFIPFMLPGCLLTMATIAVNMVRYRPLIMLTLMLAIVLAALLAWAFTELRQPLINALCLPVVTLPYIYGVLTMANMRCDRAAATCYRRPVLEKTTSTARDDYRSLTLPPWGPRTATNVVSVSRRVHQAVKIGDTVEVYLHRGALGFPWYIVLSADNAPK